MDFELACLEDFNEIENLYWDLIDKTVSLPRSQLTKLPAGVSSKK